MKRPVKSPTIAQQLVEQMREAIAKGDWMLGTKIPGEIELATKMGVSRSSVREAIRSLVHAGLLEARPGSGTFVIAQNEAQIALRRISLLEERKHIYEVRRILEVEAARLAAMRRRDSDLALMKEALTNRDNSETVEEYVEHDVTFHSYVIASTKNPFLQKIYEGIFPIGRSVMEMVDNIEDGSPMEAKDVNDAHYSLLDAIRRQDESDAAEWAATIISLAASY